MKLTIISLLICLMWFPTLASGMEAISDEDLSTISAQAGITVAVDDVILYQSFGKISFIDSDGGNQAKNPFPYEAVPRKPLLDLAGPAALNLEGVRMDVIRVNAITPQGTLINNQDSHFKISDSQVISTFKAKPMTIDLVDELPALSPGYNYMLSAKNSLLPLPVTDGETYNRTGIAIGLPTIDIYIDELSIRGLTVTTLNREAVNDGSSMGQFGIKGLDLAILSGISETAAHKDTGIDMAVDDVRLYLKIDELAFRDTDGLNIPAATGGPANLVIKDMEADLISLNALTHTDFNILNLLGILAGTIKLNVQSPGEYNCNLYEMDNYLMLDLLDRLKSFHGQPILIDTPRCLGLTATIIGGNIGLSYYDQVPYAVAGVFMALGTVEVYTDNLNIGKVTIEDPSHMAVNDGASFFPITMKGAQVDFLAGYLEISSH
ncbi:MAG TPA: hypothetical protein PKM41_07435 [Deltaproteobacteria bacterium]|nr:hypothetical protein [Deltaproteobacteria bacterium]HOI06955.1 hypothetical protein [Deltaproteobacteria bacterium]